MAQGSDGERLSSSTDLFAVELQTLARELIRLRVASGQPPLRVIASNAPDQNLSSSALSDVFNGKRLPGIDVLLALVRTLLGMQNGRNVPVSHDDPRLEQWRTRWRRLQELKNEPRETHGPASPETGRLSAEAEEADEMSESYAPDAARTVRIFVAMPGSTMGGEPRWSNISEIRRRLLEPVARRIGELFECETELVIEKEKTAMGTIHRSMFSEALEADVYIADLTGANPNVYLELGVRWAVRDAVTVLICQNIKDVRFNAAASRVIGYDQTPDALEEAIGDIAEAAVTGLRSPAHVDSPVRDGAAFITLSRSAYDRLQEEISELRGQQAEDLIDAALAKPDLSDCIELLRQAIARNPATLRGHFELGVALAREGLFREALASLRTCVQIRDDYAPAWREIGTTLSREIGSTLGTGGGDEREAVFAFDRAVFLDPNDAETWATLGGLRRRLARRDGRGGFDVHELEKALTCYQKSSALSGNKTYPLLNIARIELLLAGLRGTDTSPAVERFQRLEHLARYAAEESAWCDPWSIFDLADTLLLTGRAAEGVAELRKGIDLVAPHERKSVLGSFVAPLRDFLSVDGLLQTETAHAVQRAVDECERAIAEQDSAN